LENSFAVAQEEKEGKQKEKCLEQNVCCLGN